MFPTFATSRRLWWGLAVVVVLLWAFGSLLPEIVSGVSAEPLITSVLLPLARFIRDITGAVTVGCVVVGGLVAPSVNTRVLRWSMWWAAAWAFSGACLVLLLTSDVAAIPVLECLSPSVWWPLLTEVPAGRVLLVQVVAAVLVLLLAGAVISRPTAWVVTVIAVAGASAAGLAGHGNASAHVLASAALSIHLAAVSLWIGGLVAVITLVRRNPVGGMPTLRRYSPMALACVIVLAETGLLTASLHVASPSRLIASDYGALLVLKAALLLGLVQLAWRQRSRLAPPSRDTDGMSVGALARLAAWELLVMGAAVGVGVVMARVGPDGVAPRGILVNPLMAGLLVVVIPVLGRRIVPSRSTSRMAVLSRSYPEQVSVATAVAIALLAGVGVLTNVFGAELGALMTVLGLLAVGWWQAGGLAPGGARSAHGAAAVGWVVAAIATAWAVHGRSGTPATVPLWVVTSAMVVTMLVVNSRVNGSHPDTSASTDAEVDEVAR